MKGRMRVVVGLYEGVAQIRVRRRFSSDWPQHAVVAAVRLDRDDAYERLAEARSRAKDLCKQLNELEGR